MYFQPAKIMHLPLRFWHSLLLPVKTLNSLNSGSLSMWHHTNIPNLMRKLRMLSKQWNVSLLSVGKQEYLSSKHQFIGEISIASWPLSGWYITMVNSKFPLSSLNRECYHILWWGLPWPPDLSTAAWDTIWNASCNWVCQAHPWFPTGTEITKLSWSFYSVEVV